MSETITRPSDVYRLFFHPGEVAEIRGLGLPHESRGVPWDGYPRAGVVFGYTDNAEKFEALSMDLDGKSAEGVYFTFNPVDAALLARASNRLVAPEGKRAPTSDKHVALIRWFYVDVDPVRHSGISASDEERRLALQQASAVVGFLEKDLGFSSAVRAMSGNGYHLLFRIPDAEPTDELCGKTGIMARALQALAEKFDTDAAKVDQGVHNPARMAKVYGTTARKGDATPDRPHRKAVLIHTSPGPLLSDVGVTPMAKLRALADLAPRPEPRPTPEHNPTRREGGNLGTVKVGEYLANYGVEVHSVRPGKKGGTVYALKQCVFDPDHRDGDAAIIEDPVNSPHLAYQCFHNSCSGRTWKEARAVISGDESIARFCDGYDPGKYAPAKRDRKAGADAPPGEDEDTPPPATFDLYIKPYCEILTGSGLPAPELVDPLAFFQIRGKKGRKGAFMESRMADYVAAYLAPLAFTQGIFYRYLDGYWQEMESKIVDWLVQAVLKDEARASYCDATRNLLSNKLFRPEKAWEDRPPMHVCLENGMLDLFKMELVPHDPKYNARAQLPIRFDESAKAPKWQKFLKEVFPDTPDRADSLQEFLGYCLMPTCAMEKCLFMFGTGGNGKSIVLNVLEDILGQRNISSIPLEELANPFAVPNLRNKLVNLAAEVEVRRPASTELFKQAISGDLLGGELKYASRIEFRTTVKFIFSANNVPTIADKSRGFTRKIMVIHFARKFLESEMDRSLLGKLLEEKEGIFLWMLAGVVRLQTQEQFTIGESVARDTDAFMSQIDPLLVFLAEECIKESSAVTPKELCFARYVAWCNASGHRPVGKAKFYGQIVAQWPELHETKATYPDGSRRHSYVGIRLEDHQAEMIGG